MSATLIAFWLWLCDLLLVFEFLLLFCHHHIRSDQQDQQQQRHFYSLRWFWFLYILKTLSFPFWIILKIFLSQVHFWSATDHLFFFFLSRFPFSIFVVLPSIFHFLLSYRTLCVCVCVCWYSKSTTQKFWFTFTWINVCLSTGSVELLLATDWIELR